MSDWLVSLGYLGAFIGAFLEGEVVLLSALQAVRTGYLNLGGILLSFSMGTLAADWFFYLTGRHRGRTFLERRPRMHRPFIKMERQFNKWGYFLLLTYRFMYGFRVVLPLLFGLSGVKPLRFAFYSLMGTALWISFFTVLSLFFTGLVMEAIHLLKSWSWALLLIPIAIATAVWWYRKHYSSSPTNENQEDTTS
jgi:membrane protein DedA with SNARE-associated domain